MHRALSAEEAGVGWGVHKPTEEAAPRRKPRAVAREYRCGKCGFLPKRAKHNCQEELKRTGNTKDEQSRQHQLLLLQQHRVQQRVYAEAAQRERHEALEQQRRRQQQALQQQQPREQHGSRSDIGLPQDGSASALPQSGAAGSGPARRRVGGETVVVSRTYATRGHGELPARGNTELRQVQPHRPLRQPHGVAQLAAAVTVHPSLSSTPVGTTVGHRDNNHGAAADADRSTGPGRSARGSIKPGDRVVAHFKGAKTRKYPGVVNRINADGTFDISFDDGDRDNAVKAEHVFLGATRGKSAAAATAAATAATPATATATAAPSVNTIVVTDDETSGRGESGSPARAPQPGDCSNPMEAPEPPAALSNDDFREYIVGNVSISEKELRQLFPVDYQRKGVAAMHEVAATTSLSQLPSAASSAKTPMVAGPVPLSVASHYSMIVDGVRPHPAALRVGSVGRPAQHQVRGDSAGKPGGYSGAADVRPGQSSGGGGRTNPDGNGERGKDSGGGSRSGGGGGGGGDRTNADSSGTSVAPHSNVDPTRPKSAGGAGPNGAGGVADTAAATAGTSAAGRPASRVSAGSGASSSASGGEKAERLYTHDETMSRVQGATKYLQEQIMEMRQQFWDQLNANQHVMMQCEMVEEHLKKDCAKWYGYCTRLTEQLKAETSHRLESQQTIDSLQTHGMQQSMALVQLRAVALRTGVNPAEVETAIQGAFGGTSPLAIQAMQAAQAGAMHAGGHPMGAMMQQAGGNPMHMGAMMQQAGGNPMSAMMQQAGGNPMSAMMQQAGGNPMSAMMQQAGGNPMSAMMQQAGGDPMSAMMQQAGGDPMSAMNQMQHRHMGAMNQMQAQAGAINQMQAGAGGIPAAAMATSAATMASNIPSM